MIKKIYLLLILPILSVIVLIVLHSPVFAACQFNPTSTNSVSTTVSIPVAGTYQAWSRILPQDTTNNSYWLQVDGQCAIPVGDSTSIPANTFTWVGYQNGNTADPVLVSFSAGIHTVVLTEREAGLGIDRLVFSSSTSCTPTGNGDNCALIPTSTLAPTNSPLPTTPPTLTPTTPVVASPTPPTTPLVTVSAINMSFQKTGNSRVIGTVVTVVNETTGTKINGAIISMTLRAPSGAITNFSGNTNSSGQIEFDKTLKEVGTYVSTVTNVVKSGYTYHATNTTKSLIVK